jgi:exodeoxyribonuclease V alpha subunit
MPEASAMSEGLQAILELHRDRAQFPAKVIALLPDLNQDASALILAWELAAMAPALDTEQRRRLFAITLAVLVAQGQGHTRLALAPAEGGATEAILQAFGLAPFDLTAFLQAEALAPLVGQPGETKPLILTGAWLYTHRLLGHEQDLADQVLRLTRAGQQSVAPVAEAVFTDPVPLNAEQRQAVAMVLAGSLTLITGGPGTGKTAIVIAILRALLHQPGLTLADIALAAPTGKAAQRMGESIRASLGGLQAQGDVERLLLEAELEPRTLHRLLAWHPASERFRHGPGHPLAAKVVIVDEASMVSQEHLFRLLGALASGTRLVLLGDADQLPSVEAGCAFRDLVASLAPQRVQLLESYRMRADHAEGRNILTVARTINAPGSGSLWEGAEPIHCRETLAGLTWKQVELLDPGQVSMEAFLDLWFERMVTGLAGFQAKAQRAFTFHQGVWGAGEEEALQVLFDHFKGFRILCALREAGDLRGVEMINERLHRQMLKLTGEGLKGLTPFCAGEPVLMQANDYRRGIYNGDQGLILKVRSGEQLRQAAVFPRVKGFAAFPLEPLKHQLEHAFAMTVHKSQGSEYASIALVLPKHNHKALTRELLYTGLTRAKQSVVLVAERERIPFAAGNPSRRDSGLGERLGGTR